MKFRISEGINSVNGMPTFYLYQSVGGDPEVWQLRTGGSLDDCRTVAARLSHPVPERVVEELEM